MDKIANFPFKVLLGEPSKLWIFYTRANLNFWTWTCLIFLLLLLAMKSGIAQPKETCESDHRFFSFFPLPQMQSFAAPVNGAGRLLRLPSMSSAPIQHQRDLAVGLSLFTESCWLCTSLEAWNLNAALQNYPILKNEKKKKKKEIVAKRTQLTLIYLISLYTRQNQGRVSCSLYSGNIVVCISHIVEPYNATCVYDYHSCQCVGIHFLCLLSNFCQAVFPCRSLSSFRISWICSLFFFPLPLFLLLAIMCVNMI